MAEARQAIVFPKSLKPDRSYRNIAGIASKCLYRSAKERFIRIKNNFHNGMYPSQPGSWPKVAILVFLSSFFGVDLSFGFIGSLEALLNRRVNMDKRKSVVLSALLYSLILWISGILIMRYTLMCLYSYTRWIYEVHSGFSWKTKLWVMLVKLFKGGKPGLYSFQRSLPKLPLPSVSDTIRRYLLSMEPLLDESEFSHIKALANEFETRDAKKLQNYLKLKRLWASNYVSDWWEDYVYLHARSPLVINSNIYALDTLIRHPTSIPAARAAHCIAAAVRFMLQIIFETLEPVVINGLVPLCMAQYRRTFGTTRIPGLQRDTIDHRHDVPNHIVIIHRGRYFKFRFFHNNRLLDERELERMVQFVLDDQSEPTPGEAKLAALTGGDRTHWAITRQEFFSTGVNAASLSLIEKAAFVMCLDDEEYIPNGVADADALDRYARATLHGNGMNRWFEKSINIIMGRNCCLGITAEHSWADAPVMGHLWEFILSEPTSYDHNGHCRGRITSAIPTPRHLIWDFNEQCCDAIDKSLCVVTNLINDVDLHVMMYRTYGKSFVSAQCLSPDAYFQLALQLAYYRATGSLCFTYEASMTRLFREGRTETVRSVTKDSVAFVRAMQDTKASPSDRLRQLRVAAAYHQNLYRDAMTGKGVDRHLFCLYVVAKHLDVKSPFLQEVVSQRWHLSTSQTPYGQTARVRSIPQFSDYVSIGGGFGPVSDEGYGVSYIVASENTTFFHISSKRSCLETDSRTFAGHLSDVLDDMQSLFS